MYDSGKIIAGIIIFLILITSPVWYNVVSGKAAYTPKLEIVTKEKQCVEPKQFMRAKHMELMDEWRLSVVRAGNRIYTASDGRTYDMSLTRTCLGCHSNKEQFCDRCHNYASVTPTCWNCHVIPKESKS
jgi:hypothetical protein